MNPKDTRIIFMGTPEFAVASLRALVENSYKVVAVVTAPDKPAGRGRKLQVSAVKTYALAHDLPLLQPEKLKDEHFLAELKSYKAELQIVVAFRMLPEVVWRMPYLKTFNLHASLLPDYRGAAPINWTIINGEKKSGVTTFFIQHAIDTGDIIAQKEVAISPNMNVGELYEQLMNEGAILVCKSVDDIVGRKVRPCTQDESKALNSAPKIFKHNCCIDWEQAAERVHNLVRGLSPYPAAWSILDDGKKRITAKVFATLIAEPCEAPAGTIRVREKSHLFVATATHWIEIRELQLAGKRRMKAKDALCGFDFEYCRFMGE